MYKIIVLVVLVLWQCTVYGQPETDEFFHEIELTHTYVDNQKWRGAATVTWKHIYDDIGWRRWGGDLYISRKVNFVSLELGTTANYTFDKEIVNFFEVRPWLCIRTDIRLADRLALMQKFRVENRNFLYSEGVQNEQIVRGRFLLSFKYDFLKHNNKWKLNPSTEWYFIERVAKEERFVNSVEFGLRLIRAFAHGQELTFGYKLETYKKSLLEDGRKRGHIFMLGYGF